MSHDRITQNRGVTCTACNHQHPTMAVLWHDDDTVTLLCHEDDHSCYVDFVVEKEPAEAFEEYVRGIA